MTSSSFCLRLVFIAILCALLFRLYPVAVGMPTLAEAFMTEDGYLMLTVARNMAIGLGMSVSDGTIATNGVQPLAAILFTIPYLVTGGDKVMSLIGVHLILAMISAGGLLAIRAFAEQMLRGLGVEVGALFSWIVAGLWFLGPVPLHHSMNGLETGLITLVTVVTVLQFGRVVGQGAEATLLDRLGLGLLCGLAFLARIDAAILSVMIFTIWALDILLRQRLGFRTALAWLLPSGFLSLAVAAPWLLNNLVGFGSLMPSSGAAQSLSAEIGGNAILLPAKTFEFLFPMLPVPKWLEQREPFLVFFVIVIAIVLGLFLLRLVRFGSPVGRAVLVAYLLHGLALATYYGVFFGAPHFLSRYLAPIAPLLILASVTAAMDLGRWLIPNRRKILALTYGLGGLALSGALLVRFLLPGAPTQGHEQVVAWVEENVPEDVWVGAVQTGTLGYWHDRTINLDGKVNPEALEARRIEGHVLDYVVESEIEYIVDWAGVGGWVQHPSAQDSFADTFELVLQDWEANLSVMRRVEDGS